MGGESWRRAVVGLTVALTSVIAAMALPSAQAEGTGGRATVEWNDSSPSFAGEGVDPCAQRPQAICIAEAWLVTSDGLRVAGVPLAKVEGSGWLYRYSATGVSETLWIEISRTPDPSPNGYILVPAYIRRVQPNDSGSTSACTREAANPDALWCAREMARDLRIGVTIRSDYASTGWIDGRLSEPRVDVTPGREEGSRLLTIEAAPLLVPTLTKTLWFDDARDRASWSRIVETNGAPWGDGAGLGPLPDWSASPDDDRYFARFPAITPMLFNQLSRAVSPALSKATGWVDLWRAEAWFLSEPPVYQDCWSGSGGLMGVTSSNALTYKRELVWDDFTRQLVFTMAGPTFDADGSRMRGDFYSMLSRDAVACFWGEAGPQAQVRIEVTSEDGVEVPATVSVDRRSGGIYLRATGFGFSLKKATVSEVRKGAPAAPRGVTARSRGSSVVVNWKSVKGVAYRVRLTPVRFGEQPVITGVPSGRRGSVTFQRRSPGDYLVDVVALRGRLQSQVTTASVSVG